MIRINNLIQSAILSILGLDQSKVKPYGLIYMDDNGRPMFVLFYDGFVPDSDKYYKVKTAGNQDGIVVKCDILSYKYGSDNWLHYED